MRGVAPLFGAAVILVLWAMPATARAAEPSLPTCNGAPAADVECVVVDDVVVTDKRLRKQARAPRFIASTERRPAFASFEVVDHADPKSPTFVFSAARATTDDPVMISIPGRAMTGADRTFRTSLQRHWLSVNVPASYEWSNRALVECRPKGTWEHRYCDSYQFLDPATGAGHDYYIFVGNWP